MADRSLRGIRLGAQSLQSEDGVVFHDRAQHTYVCATCGRETVLTFAADAEVPP
ncbi:RNA polymerase-binding protein RbpA, partial [Streptomyces caniscabiei]|uniref:RNA polymerase-binding protein RbpA n=2 Tax=Actinomycetes TaxID=1760 RepID=UPI0038F76927